MSTQPQLDVRVLMEGTAVLVHVSGELDLAVQPVFAEAVDRAVALSHEVIIDLGEVPFMDSTGLHVIATAVRAVEGAGSVTLRNVRSLPATVLRLSGLAEQVQMTLCDDAASD